MLIMAKVSEAYSPKASSSSSSNGEEEESECTIPTEKMQHGETGRMHEVKGDSRLQKGAAQNVPQEVKRSIIESSSPKPQ